MSQPACLFLPAVLPRFSFSSKENQTGEAQEAKSQGGQVGGQSSNSGNQPSEVYKPSEHDVRLLLLTVDLTLRLLPLIFTGLEKGRFS